MNGLIEAVIQELSQTFSTAVTANYLFGKGKKLELIFFIIDDEKTKIVFKIC